MTTMPVHSKVKGVNGRERRSSGSTPLNPIIEVPEKSPRSPRNEGEQQIRSSGSYQVIRTVTKHGVREASVPLVNSTKPESPAKSVEITYDAKTAASNSILPNGPVKIIRHPKVSFRKENECSSPKKLVSNGYVRSASVPLPIPRKPGLKQLQNDLIRPASVLQMSSTSCLDKSRTTSQPYTRQGQTFWGKVSPTDQLSVDSEAVLERNLMPSNVLQKVPQLSEEMSIADVESRPSTVPVRPSSLPITSVHEFPDKPISNSSVSPKLRLTHNTQTKSPMVGQQAIKECEEHSTWVNEVLRKRKLPPIWDLRKSLGDGTTLCTIVEALTGEVVRGVKLKPGTKDDKIENLERCLSHLDSHGVDITGIDASELGDGHLKTSLVVIGNIRKKFDTSTKESPEDDGDVSSTRQLALARLNEIKTRPMKLPGAVATPIIPTNMRDHSGSPTRKMTFGGDDYIPGAMTKDSPQRKQHTPTSIISTTELDVNGVSQHGVEERRQHFAGSAGPAGRAVTFRSGSGKGYPQDRGPPPGSATQAWSLSVRPQSATQGLDTGPTIEDRLRNLISNGSRGSSRELNQGHKSFDDGEMLVPPPPEPRNSPDFSIVSGGNRFVHQRFPSVPQQGGSSQRGNYTGGYVPSKPSERYQGSRSEALIDRGQQQQNGPATQDGRQSALRSSGDHRASHHQELPNAIRSGKSTPDPDQELNVAMSPRGTGNELRNAWNRLYGQNGPPPNRVDQSPLIHRRMDHSGLPPNRREHGSVSPSRVEHSFPSNRPDKSPIVHNRMEHGIPQHNRQDRGPGSPTRVDHGGAPPSRVDHNGAATSRMDQNHPAGGRIEGTRYQPQRPWSQQQNHMQPYSMKYPPNHVPFSESSRPSSQVPVQIHQISVPTGHVPADLVTRESPMGQSSSNQGQSQGSSSSQMSAASQHAVLGVNSSLDTSGEKVVPSSPNFAIGPGTKYPDDNIRPSSAKSRPPPLPLKSVQQKQEDTRTDKSSLGDGYMKMSGVHFSASTGQSQRETSSSRNSVNFVSKPNVKKTHFAPGLGITLPGGGRTNPGVVNQAFVEDSEISQVDAQDSIFDYYEASHSGGSSGSVTPPLPPLSPMNTPTDSDSSESSVKMSRSLSATNLAAGLAKAPDILTSTGRQSDRRKPRRSSDLQMRLEKRNPRFPPRGAALKSKGASLNEVQEGSDDASNLSFDIENTILTVESHDTEQPRMHETPVVNSNEASALWDYLHGLESKYDDIIQRVGGGKDQPSLIPGRQRRWSIGSSDTSSFKRESKFKQGKHHKHSREFKNINKRFQRLESHVVTLARSVAHLSSELRTHNAMVHDLDTIKKEVREIKEGQQYNPFTSRMPATGNNLNEFERFRGWVPSLTNPKRVNKLTKFFGTEPPLLEIFLKKLGYERFVPNFEAEHIGMIELPYMTEDRLEKIGIPMGPRLRILQEAQLCFRQENFNIYIV